MLSCPVTVDRMPGWKLERVAGCCRSIVAGVPDVPLSFLVEVRAWRRSAKRGRVRKSSCRVLVVVMSWCCRYSGRTCCSWKFECGRHAVGDVRTRGRAPGGGGVWCCSYGVSGGTYAVCRFHVTSGHVCGNKYGRMTCPAWCITFHEHPEEGRHGYTRKTCRGGGGVPWEDVPTGDTSCKVYMQ